MSRRSTTLQFTGGLNLVDSPLKVRPGELLIGTNFEPILRGGYKRLTGYERYDGRPRPSEASYWILDFQNATAAVLEGDIVDGATSGASGEALIDAVLESGSYGGGDAAGYLVLTNVTSGPYTDGEDLEVSAVKRAEADGAEAERSADTTALDATYLQDAADTARALIGAVPGSGDILGVWVYGSDVYAFRNNAGGTAAIMHKATAAGWTTVTTPALSPGGTYRFVNHNFGGHAGSVKMYGCDGQNKAFQFDGTTFTQITTGMTTDTPTHIAVHQNHLFLAFSGGSVQNSSLGDPLTWAVVTGANEIAIGDEVTNLVSLTDTGLGIFTRNNTFILYGTSVADFVMANTKKHAENTGAIEDTVQSIAGTVFLDDRGLTTLQAALEYGNFKTNTISQKIEPLLTPRKTLVAGSMLVREKSQYRIFFTDKSGFILTFDGNRVSGITTMLLDHVITTSCSLEDGNGNEVMYFGSDDGFVYQMDAGISFDGVAYKSFARLAFNHFGSPRQRKKIRHFTLDVDGQPGATILFQPDYDYSSADVPLALATTIDLQGGGGFWNVANWNDFLWSSQIESQAVGYIPGTFLNLGLLVYTESATTDPYTLHGAHFIWSPQGIKL